MIGGACHAQDLLLSVAAHEDDLLSKGNLIVSDWAGRTALIEPSGAITILLDTRAEKINAADLAFVPGEDLVVIPTFRDNRVMAAKLRY